MPKFIVSEDVEIVLDGNKYLLEVGDAITIDESKPGASPSIAAAMRRQSEIDAKLDAGRSTPRTFKVIEDRDTEVLKSIISELMNSMKADAITVNDVVDVYNDKFDPKDRMAGKAFNPKQIEALIRQSMKQQVGLLGR